MAPSTNSLNEEYNAWTTDPSWAMESELKSSLLNRSAEDEKEWNGTVPINAGRRAM